MASLFVGMELGAVIDGDNSLDVVGSGFFVWVFGD
jgi:hypothetical protein